MVGIRYLDRQLLGPGVPVKTGTNYLAELVPSMT
jgi:hypothetical protein